MQLTSLGERTSIASERVDRGILRGSALSVSEAEFQNAKHATESHFSYDLTLVPLNELPFSMVSYPVTLTI